MALRDRLAWGRARTTPTTPPRQGRESRLRDWLHPEREALEERAAIMQHCGGLTREEAEQEAQRIASTKT